MEIQSKRGSVNMQSLTVTCWQCKHQLEVLPERVLPMKNGDPRYYYVRCTYCGEFILVAKSLVGPQFKRDCQQMGKG